VLGISTDRRRILSGQFKLPDGFEHWLLKFDGMGRDDALGDSQQYGRIEYAYHRMASAAGITMMPCELLEENGRAHFMTRRFDRIGNQRVRVQSLCALAHLSFDLAGTHAYESLLLVARTLDLDDEAMRQLFLRMAFNIAAANHDDHTRNFAFLLPEGGTWQLAPAYDVTFGFRADSPWVNQHPMSVNGRFSAIDADDLMAVADRFSIPGARAALRAVDASVHDWPTQAREAGVGSQVIEAIASRHVTL
jgi:serine/threonine-protein kinase HipA